MTTTPHDDDAPVLVIATSNAGKLREFREMLGDLAISLRSLADYPGAPDVVEDADSFAGNARKKALAYAAHAGEAVLADDSGLEVDALGGAPGVHSARYAGDAADAKANVAKLLDELAEVPADERTARFRCVLAVVVPNGASLLAEGTCEGHVTTEPHGTGGFGYDPVFIHAEFDRTFAEATADEKNRVSHRRRALEALRPELVPFLRGAA